MEQITEHLNFDICYSKLHHGEGKDDKEANGRIEGLTALLIGLRHEILPT